MHAHKRLAAANGDTNLLMEFPFQGGERRFALGDLAAWKFPQTHERAVVDTLGDQYAAFVVKYDTGSNLDDDGVRHRRQVRRP